MNEPQNLDKSKLLNLTQSLISDVSKVKEGMSITLALLNAITQDLHEAQELLLQEHSDRSRILKHYTAVGIELGAVIDELNEYKANQPHFNSIVTKYEQASVLFESARMTTWVKLLKSFQVSEK